MLFSRRHARTRARLVMKPVLTAHFSKRTVAASHHAVAAMTPYPPLPGHQSPPSLTIALSSVCVAPLSIISPAAAAEELRCRRPCVGWWRNASCRAQNEARAIRCRVQGRLTSTRDGTLLSAGASLPGDCLPPLRRCLLPLRRQTGKHLQPTRDGRVSDGSRDGTSAGHGHTGISLERTPNDCGSKRATSESIFLLRLMFCSFSPKMNSEYRICAWRRPRLSCQ